MHMLTELLCSAHSCTHMFVISRECIHRLESFLATPSSEPLQLLMSSLLQRWPSPSQHGSCGASQRPEITHIGLPQRIGGANQRPELTHIGLPQRIGGANASPWIGCGNGGMICWVEAEEGYGDKKWSCSWRCCRLCLVGWCWGKVMEIRNGDVHGGVVGFRVSVQHV